MRFNKGIGLFAAALLTFSCFIPWVVIESRQITVSGTDATGTAYGKPGYLHLAMAVLFLFFHLTPRLWAKRANLLVVALNTAWAIKNFFLIAVCRGGECPARKAGLYLMLAASLLMLIAALFPDMDIDKKEK
jgi:hypothetical protein